MDGQQSITVPYRRAREILLNWEPYRSMDAWEIGFRTDVPLALGYATILHDNIFLSWTRLPTDGGAIDRMVRGEAPVWADWSGEGPVFWLVDVAGMPGTNGIQLGRDVRRWLVDNGHLAKGERCMFRRHLGRRFGWALG